MEKYYGALVGLFSTIPFAIAGMYTSTFSKKDNRIWKLIYFICILSMLQIGTGLIDSFFCLAFFKTLYSIFISAIPPLSYSLMTDFFPSDRRTTANSILASGSYMGIALSSMSIVLIKRIGWRNTYKVMGCMGLLAAGIMLFVKEPIRGQFDPAKYQVN